MEWLTNIWNWVVENKDAIFSVVSSAEFVAVVGLLLSLLRARKGTSENTAVSKELKSALEQTKQANKDIAELRAEIRSLQAKNEAIEDTADTTLTKVSALVSALEVVYGNSIKDVDVRKTVTTILTNAKYSETATRAELVKLVEELRAKAETNAKEAEVVAKETKKILAVEDSAVLRG
jgi:hypothetical protein